VSDGLNHGGGGGGDGGGGTLEKVHVQLFIPREAPQRTTSPLAQRKRPAQRWAV
jgi:hypothetical protein